MIKLIIFAVFAVFAFADSVSKNILILDKEEGVFSKTTLPKIMGYKYNIYSPEKLQEDIITFNDTFILFQSLAANFDVNDTKLINSWIRNGGKLLIMHKDTEKSHNRFEWLPYGYKFTTNSVSSRAKDGAGLARISEYNFFTKSLDIDDINKNTNAFSAANVMIYHEHFWNSSLISTNVNETTGPALAYAKYGKGVIIYCGLSMRDIYESSSLNDIYKTILALPWNPDPLPYTNAASVEIPPPLVRVSGISSGKVDLVWKTPAWLKGIRGYRIYRSVDDGENKTLIADVDNANFYQDTNATDNTTYSYYVSSYDDLRDSSFSMPAFATPPGDVVSGEEMMIVTPDGNYTGPVTALSTTDNFSHITGDAFFTSQKISADPVSLATGGFFLSVEDLNINGKNEPVKFIRAYNSIYKENGDDLIIGNGWRHNYMINIYSNPDGTLSLNWGDGHTDSYLKSSENDKTVYFEPASNRVYSKLEKIRGEGYRLITKEGVLYSFDVEGNIISINSKEGRTLVFDYESNRLKKIMDRRSKRYISLEYKGKKISKVCALNKLCVSYEYDKNDNLIKATEADGNIITYEYNSNFQMTASRDFDNNIFFENRYKNGQVVSQLDPFGHETKFEYIKGGITKVTDREDRISIYEHDSLGRLIKESDPMGKSLKYFYNTQGEIAKKVEKDGTFTTYSYDDMGNLLYKKDQFLNIKSMEYDENSNLLTMTDENGNENNFEYDKNGLLLKISDSLNNSTNYSYNKNNELIAITNANGGTITYSYNDKGDIQEIKDTLGNSRFFKYDDLGRRIETIDEYGYSLKYQYDKKDNVVKIVDGNGNTVKYSYNAFGKVISKTNPNGHSTHFEYDKNLRMIKKTNALGHITEYKYSNEGNLIKKVDPSGKSSYYEYDKLNKKIAIISNDGNRTSMSYDLKGKMVSFTDPLGNKITIEYDARGLITDSISPSKSRSSTVYTKNELPQTIIDPLGRKNEFFYDKNNRIVVSIDQLGQKTKNRYDKIGNKTETQFANGESIKYSYYNGNNHITTITEQNGKITKFFYDKRRSLSRLEHPSGKYVEFFYDKANRLIGKKTLNDEILYKLDANGNKLKITYDNNRSATIKKYNALNSLTSQTDRFGNTISYKYDKSRNLKTLIYSDGSSVKYSYDSLNRINQVTDFNGNITKYFYRADGKIASVMLPDGFMTSYEYDKDGRLISKVDKKSKNILSSYKYKLNSAGERIEEKRKEPLALNQKESEIRITYERANMATKSNEYKLSYDEDGNLLQKTSKLHNVKIEYDDFGRVILKNDTKFYYDADNLRIKKESLGEINRYVYDTSTHFAKLIEIHDAKGNILKKFVYGIGLISESDDKGSFVYHYDTRGSTVALTDIKGKVQSTYSYDIYGKVMDFSGKRPAMFSYVGQYGVIDDGDGFYFMRTREYDSSLMRFIQKDKMLLGTVINSQSLNRYSYVEGDPIRGIDPMGAWFLGDDALVAGMGALIEIAKQVVTDMVEGEMSSTETYVAAAVKGATKAQVLLYTANISLAEASGTFAGDIAKQGLEISYGKREEIDYKGALKAAAISAVGASLFDPASAKPATGFDEAFDQVKKHAKSTIKNIAPRVTELLGSDEKAKISLVQSEAAMQNSDVKLHKFK